VMTGSKRPASASTPVALVTGSSRDIGRAIVLRLASDGCDVVVHSMSSKDEGEDVAAEAREFGVRAEYRQADVRDYDQVGVMLREVGASLGPVSVVVNNAA
jgi:NAD(P)-dependent dehydrogenase (short-subunit alcohol dehydrogenase family)